MNERKYTRLVKLSLGANIFLVFCVIVLAFYMFKGGLFCKAGDGESIAPVRYSSKGSQAVAFVNIDTINAKYTMVEDLRKSMEQERTRLENDFIKRQTQFEQEVQSFNNKIQSKTISADDAQRTEQNLQLKQQQLMQLEQQYSTQLAEKETKLHKQIVDSLMNYLNRTYKNKFDYILGYTEGSNILYANDTFDITKHVLQSLNYHYKKGLKK